MHIKKTVLIAAAALALASVSVRAAPAPEWTLQDADGTTVVAKQSWAKGPTIWLFWATWCPYCKALMPHLQSMLEEYGGPQALRVFAFSFREDGDPQAFVREQGYQFTVFAEPGDLPERLGVLGTPGLFVVDTNGEIVFDLMKLSREERDGASGAKLGNRQKAARRAPWWAARIRQALDELY